MSRASLFLVFFFYGLAFFSMGLIVALEGGRGSDQRLRHALRPLAAFGIIHGVHEWLEVFIMQGALPFLDGGELIWEAFKLALLSFSFLSLAAFGSSLLAPNEQARRLSWLLPLGQAALWGVGIFVMRGQYTLATGLWDAADVWSRYVLGIPASLVACIGLIAQQRAFRHAGMAKFGRDSLWAAIAFAWYGLVGQIFTRESGLFPSTFINQNLFLALFGFPVQLLRSLAAGAAAFFVIRFLRAFEVETQRRIADLQVARLQDAEQREALRGDMLRQVVAAQEAERQRIARELHDETGQALTALGLGLRGAAGALQAQGLGANQTLNQLEGLVSHSLNELQRLIADLRPSHLDDLGLAAALRWYAGEVQQRTGLKVAVRLLGGERPMPDPVRIALFRVVQEALNNIVKHAAATQAQVAVAFAEREVSIEIQDNGRGFDLERALENRRSSWGLMGMRERVTLCGGEFSLETAPGNGTRVGVRIPFSPEDVPVPKKEGHEDALVIGG